MDYIGKARRGQGLCVHRTSLKLSVEEVKALHPPYIYYPTVLEGKFGKPSPGSWCAWLGLCPFHDDRRAGSVSINLVSGAFKCFACGAAAGDVLAFHAHLRGLDFKNVLADLGGVQ
jgi:putative DNA primase/helicase